MKGNEGNKCETCGNYTIKVTRKGFIDGNLVDYGECRNQECSKFGKEILLTN